jgi:hypothetical protein
MSAIEVDRITSKKLAHAIGQALLSCPGQQMKMLCEAQNYVKLSFCLLRFSLPFLPHFTASNDITPHNFML